MENFDMSPNMARTVENPAANGHQIPSTTTANSFKVLSAFSPWKHPKRFRPGSDRDDTMYELYSVCNHHGSDLQGGHYTALCKNPTDGQWYSFDDMNTKHIAEAEVVTKDAYILFYQKTCLSTSSSSSSSSSSGSNQEHWVYRMPDFYYKAKSETKCAPSNKPRTKLLKKEKGKTLATKTVTEKVSEKEESDFSRNSAKYATLPAKRTSDIIHLETEHHSDTEQGVKEESSDEDEDDTISSAKPAKHKA